MRTFLLGLAMLVGCGDNLGADIVGSCQFGGGQPFCFEYTNASADERVDAMLMCSDNHGTWADATCARASIIGGCRSEITGPHGRFTQVIWFYPSTAVVSVADVMSKCTSMGSEFVAP